MKAQTKINNQSGFSVIEVLITLFMIGVMLMLFQATANSIVLNKYGRFREIALRIADNKMQSMRTISFASIPTTGPFTDSQLSSLPDGEGTITVTDLTARLKEVSVLVTWTNPDETGTQQVQLNTYITSGGLGQ